MTNYGVVGKGLRLVFLGQILGILSIFPIISLIGVVLLLIGLYLAGKGEARLRPAFMCGIAELLVAVLSAWTPSVILTIAVAALDVLVIYYLCVVTSSMLDTLGKTQTAQWGRVVWKIYLIGIALLNILSMVLTSGGIALWNTVYLVVAVNLGCRFVITLILLLHLYNVYSAFEEQR